MFEDWENPPGIEILRPVDREVQVMSTALWPPPPRSSMSLAPCEASDHGLVLDDHHQGRQIAWIRSSDGGWLAVVMVTLTTADKANAITTALWLQSHQLRLPIKTYVHKGGTKPRRGRGSLRGRNRG